VGQELLTLKAAAARRSHPRAGGSGKESGVMPRGETRAGSWDGGAGEAWVAGVEPGGRWGGLDLLERV